VTKRRRGERRLSRALLAAEAHHHVIHYPRVHTDHNCGVEASEHPALDFDVIGQVVLNSLTTQCSLRATRLDQMLRSCVHCRSYRLVNCWCILIDIRSLTVLVGLNSHNGSRTLSSVIDVIYRSRTTHFRRTCSLAHCLLLKQSIT